MEKKLTSRDIQAQNTAKKVFQTAIKMITAKGYENVTVDDIAKEAGVSKGTFYLYFETKDAVLAKQFAATDEIILEIPKHLPDDTFGNQFLYFMTGVWEAFENFCGLNIMKTIYMNEISQDLRTKLLTDESRAFYAVIRDFVHKGRAQNVFRNDISEKELTSILIHSARGLMCDWSFTNGAFDLVTEGTNYFKYIIEMISNN